MAIAPLTLRPDYWETFSVRDEDLEALYNQLLENETPQTTAELLKMLVQQRVTQEIDALQNARPEGAAIYLPKEQYQPDQTLSFPALGYAKGRVVAVRPGNNPELGAFDVIEVALDKGEKRQFAAGLAQHALNEPPQVDPNDPLLNPDRVLKTYGALLTRELNDALETSPDLVRIAGRWFPRALLVDVSMGHLNLAEAVLDMAGGGPMTTRELIEQVELPTDTNAKLTEFSFNLALQEDPRFDEVGPSGEVLWFLNRLEPEAVRNAPLFLRYQPQPFDESAITPAMLELEAELDDELSQIPHDGPDRDEETVVLIYPHLAAGTLPLSDRIRRLFPTAYEAPRIRFTLILGEEKREVPGWVVRENRYVYGLRDWYASEGLMPGSVLHIRKGVKPGEVIVRAEKRRPTREWIRTVLVGADGGLVFATTKQVVQAGYDERMVMAIPEGDALEKVWELTGKQRGSFETVILNMMRELAKLNLQGHVHAQELYAAVNLVRRVPPAPILAFLANRGEFRHVGDLHFRREDSDSSEEGE